MVFDVPKIPKTKAGSSRTAEREADGFTVVLEDVRAQFGVFGEALQSLREQMDKRFDAVDRRFESMEGRFESMEGRFDSMDGRFDSMDGRVESIESRLDRNDQALGLVKTAVLESSRELKAHGHALEQIRLHGERIERGLDEKVGRTEVVERIERAVQERLP